jgi:Uma2 family endonuclease
LSQPNINPHKKYTVKDIAEWEGRWELIEGVPYFAASSSRFHQTVSRRLLAALENYLSGKRCEVFHAPFDVYMSENIDEDYDNHKNAVQPDLFLICDSKKIHERGVKGAPDWIAEIISPATAKLDRLRKFNLYEKHGVSEYWLISPYEQTVEVFVLGKNKRYAREEVYSLEEKIILQDFEDFTLEVSELFRGFPIEQN